MPFGHDVAGLALGSLFARALDSRSAAFDRVGGRSALDREVLARCALTALAAFATASATATATARLAFAILGGAGRPILRGL
ncbi:MAG TPA: hypothetical protein VF386_03185 [Usitatibacter sp.]